MTTSPETETSADRYRRLAQTLDRRIAAVPADRWDAASPCAGWSARDVVRHIIDTETGFLNKQGGLELPKGPDVDADPVAAWRHTRDEVQAVLDDPEKANREYEGMFGKAKLADTIASFYAFDLVIHGWDIAHATGIDERIPDEDLALIRSFVDGMGDNLRRPGVCGPALDPPTDADEQTRLLAMLGRRAWS